ncbi:hypothetical protein RVM24_19195 [Marinobacter sp. KM021]|uniref:COG3904 family protein n=1 Tax=Marinobacter sp. KM021 TaxID=3075616 RepID=UPI003D6B8554
MKRLVFALCLCASLQVGAAEIKISGDSSNTILWISGEITPGLYRQVVSKIQEGRKFPDRVLISSPGGNVEEAMKLGNLFRDAFTLVIPNGECSSACAAIVFSSRTYIADEAVIGLHRPYFSPDTYSSLSVNEAKKLQQSIEDRLSAYLRNMGVRDRIIERALSRSSADIWNITMQEFVDFNGQPSHIQEWLLAQCPPLTKVELSAIEHLLAYDSFLHFVEDCPEYLETGHFGNGGGACGWARYYHSGYLEGLKLGAEGRAEIKQRSQDAMTCQDDAVSRARQEFLEATRFFD